MTTNFYHKNVLASYILLITSVFLLDISTLFPPKSRFFFTKSSEKKKTQQTIYLLVINNDLLFSDGLEMTSYFLATSFVEMSSSVSCITVI